MNGEKKGKKKKTTLTDIFRDKQSAELDISSPNNTRNNSLLINKTFSISINADLQKARRAGVRNGECTAAEYISQCLHAVCVC